MSEYMRNKGIIRRISTKENINEVYKKLVDEGKIDKDAYTEYENGVLRYTESDDYDVIDGCLFDMSDAPAEYDSAEDVEEVERINDTDYRIHLYYYNGGTCDSEILQERIPKVDKAYEKRQAKVKQPHWASFRVAKEDNLDMAGSIAKFLNTSTSFKDYEILSVNIVFVGVNFADILVRERALT